MSVHARDQVLAKVEQLLTGIDGVKVVPVHHLERSETQTTAVTWRGEDVQATRAMGAPLLQERTLTVVVVLRVKDQEPEPLVSDLSARVEAHLQHARLGGIVTAWRLTGAERDPVDNSGELPVVVIALLFSASYKTRANDPTVIIT